MPELIVTDEQARVISNAIGPLEVRDQSGKHLGYITLGFTAEDIAIARERMDSAEPRLSTQQVLAHLNSLSTK